MRPRATNHASDTIIALQTPHQLQCACVASQHIRTGQAQGKRQSSTRSNGADDNDRGRRRSRSPSRMRGKPKTKRHDGCESDHHRSTSASQETHRRGKSRMPLPRKRKGLQQDNGYDNGIEYRDCQIDDYEKSEDGRDLQSPSPLNVDRKIALPVVRSQTLRRTKRKP